jgi:hypothetical protein
MSSLIHTLEMLSSVVGTLRRWVRGLKGIASTARWVSAVFRSGHCWGCGADCCCYIDETCWHPIITIVALDVSTDSWSERLAF